MGRHFQPALQAQLAGAMRQLPSEVMQARLRAVLEVDVTPRLRNVNQPVLYLRAQQDRVVPRTAGAWLLNHKPEIELAEIHGPHFLLQTQPAPAAAAVRAFMQRLQ